MGIQVKAGGRWALSRVVDNGRSGFSTGAMVQVPRLAPKVSNYFPPDDGGVWPLDWALVHLEGPVGTPDANTLLLPNLVLAGNLTAAHISGLQVASAGRLGAFDYTDFLSQLVNVPAYDPSGYTVATTFLQVLLDLFAYMQHSDFRVRDNPPEGGNTEFTDDFSTDPTSRWSQEVGTLVWDGTNLDVDVTAAGANGVWIYRYTNGLPGSLDHEAQGTHANATDYRGAGAVRGDTFGGDDAYFFEQGFTPGDDALYLSRFSAGTYTNLTNTATTGVAINDFTTLRLAAEGSAGSNVLLSWWLTNHGTSKPSDPGWVGDDDTPLDTYTDTGATRLDASSSEAGCLAGAGGAGIGDDQLDFFKVRAVSDRGPPPTLAAPNPPQGYVRWEQ